MISINKNLKIDGQLQKYYLKGNVSQGDVSLTIANITEDDVGTYCCRVEYEGWFNDGKMLFKLLIKEEYFIICVYNGKRASEVSILSDRPIPWNWIRWHLQIQQFKGFSMLSALMSMRQKIFINAVE
ncbi:hypothetical protein E2320_015348, partial [Naja naja]